MARGITSRLNNGAVIRFGSTLATNDFSGKRFDFMLTNPPYGKSWKSDQKSIVEGKEVIDHRFQVNLSDYTGERFDFYPAIPRSSDGQLLFLMEMVDKMKRRADSPVRFAGSRIASVHNGSALFTGDAGGGESNKDPDQDKLDELLNSVDLSTYGLERSRLEVKIGLDESEAEQEPANPNLRGAHMGEGDKDPLEDIVRTFNERHFAGWEATPEEQRVKFINIAKHVVAHVDYRAQVEDNPDAQNRQLALEKIIQQAISMERRRELDLYKQYASDPDFKRAFDASISRLISCGGWMDRPSV